ncbi:MAG: NUDIX domain-containing protein [archaeon]
MNTKFGVTGIIFDQVGGKNYFLLLHRKLNWSGWEFVKGGIEDGEEPQEAVLREIGEESGLLNIELVRKVAGSIEWHAKDTKYVYTVFLLRADKNEPVVLAKDIVEHDGYEWVEQGQVIGMLTHRDNKEMFKKALKLVQ